MADIKNKTEKDFLQDLAEKRETLMKINFNASGSKSKNVKEASVLKKEMARILTALNANKAKAN